jgi:hypothetical protein
MEEYYINYHTGAGNEWVEGTLDDAKKVADAGAAYTQENISIEDAEGREVACRVWCGCKFDPNETEDEESEVIQFGDFGFLGAWYA